MIKFSEGGEGTIHHRRRSRKIHCSNFSGLEKSILRERAAALGRAIIILRIRFVLIRKIHNAVISAVHVTVAGFHALVLIIMQAVDDTLRVRGGGLVDHGPQREGVHRNGHGHEAGKVDGRKGDKLHCCD
jgi:hypothetical protein